MTMIGDYAFELASIDVWKNDQFMFVQKLTFANGTAPPPLGELNFKQGKIGVGSLQRAGGGRWTASAIPGGAGGRWPSTGRFTVRVYTPGHTAISGGRIEIESLDYGNATPLIIETSLQETNFESFLLAGDNMRSLRVLMTLQEPFGAFDAALLRNKTKLQGDATLLGDWIDVSNATTFVSVCLLVRFVNTIDTNLGCCV